MYRYADTVLRRESASNAGSGARRDVDPSGSVPVSGNRLMGPAGHDCGVPDRPDTHRLNELTWEEAADAIPAADAVVLPTGSTEQHSLHLPLGTDSMRASDLTDELVRAAPEHDLSLLTLPTLEYGYSEHHMHFPGTASISPETYGNFVVDIGASMAAHGADRFVTLNTHGGNRESLGLALDRLQRDHDVEGYFVQWTDYARPTLEERWGDDWGHAGPHETAAMEILRPGLVRTDRKGSQTNRDRYEARRIRYFEDLTDQGSIGDPTRADTAFIEDVIEETTAAILSALRSDFGRS